MPHNSKTPAPRISLGNWIAGGSLFSIPPELSKKTAVAKPRSPPKKVEAPKPKEEKKDDAPKNVSEGTDSPEDVLNKAREIVAKAEAVAKKAEEEQKKLEENKKKSEEGAAAAKKKQEGDEAAAKKKEENDAAAKKKAEDADAEKKRIADATKIEEASQKPESHGRFCRDCGNRTHQGSCRSQSPPIANNPVVNVNVYGGSGNASTATTKNPGDAADAGQSNGKDKSDARATATPGDSLKFTKEQDERILSMKKAGNSWKQISMALSLDKKAVIERFKELSDDKVSVGGSDKESALPEGHEDLGEITAMFASWDDNDGNIADHEKNDGGDGIKNQKAASSNGSKKSNGSANYKKATVEDANAKKAESPKKGDASSNAEATKSAVAKNEPSKPGHQEKPEEPRTDIPISFAATIPLSEGRRNLVPDATWSIKDLECLVEVECRYRELKFHQLSAMFYNMTGRLIHHDVIKAKIMEAKLPEEEDEEDEEGKEAAKESDILHIEVDLLTLGEEEKEEARKKKEEGAKKKK